MIKYYQYTLEKFKGYRLIFEKSNLASCKKLSHEDFVILNLTDYGIKFSIDTQLIRKIKLMKMADDLIIGSAKHKIAVLLENAQEYDEKNQFGVYGQYAYSSYAWYVDTDYTSGSSGISDKQEQKHRQRNQEKRYKQKIKNYR